jgi:ferredoxin
MSSELRVDWILCDGYGLCSDLIPELIDVDDWRYPIIRPGGVPDSLMASAQRAVDCCPMLALRIEPSRLGDGRATARNNRHTAAPRGG